MNGRNLDYGHVKSDSGEGKMAKTTLLTMGRDLYSLYTLLNDQDDLPQWCHYKLAKSSADLSTVTDYLTSKITKLCLDKNIGQNQLKVFIKESMKYGWPRFKEEEFDKKGTTTWHEDREWTKQYLKSIGLL
jgi:hypothetical protein